MLFQAVFGDPVPWPTEAEEAHAGGGQKERVSSVAAIVAVEQNPIDSEDDYLHADAIDEACGTVHPKRDPNSFHSFRKLFHCNGTAKTRPNSVDIFSVPNSNKLAQPKRDSNSVDHLFSFGFHHGGAANTRPQQCRPLTAKTMTFTQTLSTRLAEPCTQNETPTVFTQFP